MPAKLGSQAALLSLSLLLLAACSRVPADAPAVDLTPQYGTANNDSAGDLTVYGTSGPYSVDRTLLPDGTVTSSIRKYTNNGSPVWSRTHNDNPEAAAGASAQDVEVDASGNAYEMVMGRRYGFFGGYIEEVVYLRKYVGGVEQWSRTSDPSEIGRSWFGEMEVTGNGVYLLVNHGYFGSSMVWYSSSGDLRSTRRLESGYVRASTSDSNGNIYVVLEDDFGSYLLQKLDPKGTRLWSQRLLGDPYENIVYLDAAISSPDALYLTGRSPGEARQAFVTRYSSATGQEVRGWSNTCTPPAAEVSPTTVVGTNVAVSGSSVYVFATATGEGYGTRGVLCKFVPETNDFVFSRLRQVWSQSLGTTSTKSAGLAVDASGDVYVNGTSQDILAGGSSFGGTDVFLRKYSNAGDIIWTR